MFDVKKNVPFPGVNSHAIKYPFGEMEVGDCFDVPTELKAKTSTAAYHYGIVHGRKFSTRKVGDHYTCWRIA